MNYVNQIQVDVTHIKKIIHGTKSKTMFIPPVEYEYEENAMRKLNGNAFKLWRYFLRWGGKNLIFYSPSAINKELGLGINGAKTAFKELVDKEFMIKSKDKDNIFIFVPTGVIHEKSE